MDPRTQCACSTRKRCKQSMFLASMPEICRLTDLVLASLHGTTSQRNNKVQSCYSTSCPPNASSKAPAPAALAAYIQARWQATKDIMVQSKAVAKIRDIRVKNQKIFLDRLRRQWPFGLGGVQAEAFARRTISTNASRVCFGVRTSWLKLMRAPFIPSFVLSRM